MSDRTPEQDFEDWFAGKVGASRLGQARSEDAPQAIQPDGSATSPEALFSAYLGAALAGYKPDAPESNIESENP